MSSATSIKRAVRLKPDGSTAVRLTREDTEKVRPPAEGSSADPPDAFRPWHFFVLASLIAATAAVVMSRESTPEHLVLISLTIAAAGGAAAAFYRMLAPLATEDPALYSEPLTDRTRATLEREKALTLRSIKELEFDRAMGKVSVKDFEEMAGRLRARALSLMKELDEGQTGYRTLIERELNVRLGQPRAGAVAPDEARTAVAGSCPACGTSNDADAAFCKRCGTRLGHGNAGVTRSEEQTADATP